MDKIENVEDQEKLLVQNSIKYLNNLTKIKELCVPTLKSLYRTKCRLMELRRHVYLPREKPNYRCQRCFMNFSEGPTKYEVKPMKLSDFAKKILRKVKNNRVLTTYQKMYYKKLQKKFPNGFGNQNKMAITCNFCKKASEIWMTKPKKTLMCKRTVTPAKRKKKAKKDKLCGLNENAVFETASKMRNQLKQGNINETNSDLTISANSRYITKNNNFNTSVSMTNTRAFETADFIPLETGTKKGTRIKFTKKNLDGPQLQTISKSKEKLQQRNLKSLSNILKNARENKNIHSSKLKQFLAGL